MIKGLLLKNNIYYCRVLINFSSRLMIFFMSFRYIFHNPVFYLQKSTTVREEIKRLEKKVLYYDKTICLSANWHKKTIFHYIQQRYQLTYNAWFLILKSIDFFYYY